MSNRKRVAQWITKLTVSLPPKRSFNRNVREILLMVIVLVLPPLLNPFIAILLLKATCNFLVLISYYVVCQISLSLQTDLLLAFTRFTLMALFNTPIMATHRQQDSL